jgi:hypothetical protein
MFKTKGMSLLKKLSEPEKSGKTIGLFRGICAIIGGLCVAYLGMTLLIFLLPVTPGESIIIPLLFNTLVWAVAALWIVLAPTKLSALLRSVVPTLCFATLIAVLFFKESV